MKIRYMTKFRMRLWSKAWSLVPEHWRLWLAIREIRDHAVPGAWFSIVPIKALHLQIDREQIKLETNDVMAVTGLMRSMSVHVSPYPDGLNISSPLFMSQPPSIN